MKKLGQHFLMNRAAIRTIVAALEIRPRDMIIEIGAGHGELTRELGFGCQGLGDGEKPEIIAIETDRLLATHLRKQFESDSCINIIEGDALKVLPHLLNHSKLKPKTYKLAGNIPYAITGRLLRIISELEPKPARCVFTLQKEVAERITAQPTRAAAVTGSGSLRAGRGMNRLAASVRFWAEPTIIKRLSKTDFRPAPKVDSAIVKFDVRCSMFDVRRSKFDVPPETYYRTVRMLFRQPRKTILNNIQLSNSDFQKKRQGIIEDLLRIGVNPNDRPQNLSVENITKIAELVAWG